MNIRFLCAAIPVSAVICSLCTFAASVSVLALHVYARYVCTRSMVVSLICYLIYRLSQSFYLTSHHKI